MRTRRWLAGLALLSVTATPMRGAPGITLPPHRLGLAAAVAAEGSAPFLPLAAKLAQALDHPVEVELYPHQAELLADLELGHVGLAVLGCEALAALPSRSGRVLGALTLAGRTRYRGVLLSVPPGTPAEAPRTALVPSVVSPMGREPLLRRRHLRPLAARGSFDALDRLQSGFAGFALVTDTALAEARRQGFPVEDFPVVEAAPWRPFEALYFSGRIPPRRDAQVRALLQQEVARSPRRINLEWRVLSTLEYRGECP